ncbi:MAG: PRC-barrel domain-containing protein [Pseudomonadota bacterium]
MSHERDSIPISRLVEADLRRSNGDLLGVVDELLIDLDSGRIEYVLATGLRGQRLRFHWSSISVENGSFTVRGSNPRLVVDRGPRAGPEE